MTLIYESSDAARPILALTCKISMPGWNLPTHQASNLVICCLGFLTAFTAVLPPVTTPAYHDLSNTL